MLKTLCTALALCFSLTLLPLALHAAEASAAKIAAAVIRERAREAETNGQLMIAQQLRNLATGLSAGQVTLADAALVVNIALAGKNASGGNNAPSKSNEPAVTAAQVTAILDGDVPPATTAPFQPSAPITITTPAPIVTNVSTPVAFEPIVEPVVEPVVEPEIIIPIATTVLTASRVGEEKTMLVMIGAGDDQQVKNGQRFIIKRGEEQIAIISATQVKASMSICIAIAGTIKDDTEIKAGDTVLSE